ncbi:HAD family hydrolase [Gammaproteobacteria bacterium]|nr:HAD family hydrolase [Gammaproteobacteria bacterium]
MKNIISMWSGPRNLSTAIMRSFANRSDVTSVLDEPFYGAYLKKTNKNHPMMDQIIATMDTSYKSVEQKCSVEEIFGYSYHKHMSQHIFNYHSIAWVTDSINCFLLRDPDLVVSSFLDKWPDGKLEDFGFIQQHKIFNNISNKQGSACPVIDSSSVLRDPESVLKKLCLKIDIPWDSKMLNWSSGIRDYDGIWAKHWYPSVMTSTGFVSEGFSKKEPLSNKAKALSDQLRPYYNDMIKYIIE